VNSPQYGNRDEWVKDIWDKITHFGRNRYILYLSNGRWYQGYLRKVACDEFDVGPCFFISATEAGLPNSSSSGYWIQNIMGFDEPLFPLITEVDVENLDGHIYQVCSDFPNGLAKGAQVQLRGEVGTWTFQGASRTSTLGSVEKFHMTRGRLHREMDCGRDIQVLP
jgi:hypothetical protein